MPLSSLEQLACIASWQRRSVVVVLWAHFDESGEHATRGALRRLTLGGFFAPWEAVKALCVSWRAALAIESLSEFHMKEIASDEHLYEQWPIERQRRLDRFADILCEHASHFGAFSYAVGSPKSAFRDAYEPGLARVMIETASLCEQSGERGRVVFARTDEIKLELVGRYFDGLRWGEYLDGYAVVASRDNPALQAAEIVARGMKRLMQDGEITRSFGKIVATGKPIRLWPDSPIADLAHYRRALAKAERPSQTPDPLPPEFRPPPLLGPCR